MSRRRPGALCDLEEIQPDAFLVHHPAIGPLLSGEGERNGDRFRLTSWRREGLIGRLRARTFVVHTLADQIAALPDLPPPPPIGAPVIRPEGKAERISCFSAALPGWAQAPVGPHGILLHEGAVIRRRRGRGPASYALVGSGGALQPLDEDVAVRLGYAQIAAQQPIVTLQPTDEGAFLPGLPLPEAHHILMGRLATVTRTGWHIAQASIPLVKLLFARIGVALAQDA
jgi:hypothetical protein